MAARPDAGRSARPTRAGWPPTTTRTSTWSASCCPGGCTRISTTSTPSAAGRTIWATRSATRAESLRLLEWWRGELDAMYAGAAAHPVFVALRGHGARGTAFRSEPFADLIRAFVQDQTVTRYRDWDERARLLPLLRQSGGPPGALPVRLLATRSGSASPTPPARRCNWPISGRT